MTFRVTVPLWVANATTIPIVPVTLLKDRSPKVFLFSCLPVFPFALTVSAVFWGSNMFTILIQAVLAGPWIVVIACDRARQLPHVAEESGC